MIELKPCPFCGAQMDADDPDAMHPSGIGWRENEDGTRNYVNHTNAPESQQCWRINCTRNGIGCGASMHSDSKQEVIEEWNKRTAAKEIQS